MGCGLCASQLWMAMSCRVTKYGSYGGFTQPRGTVKSVISGAVAAALSQVGSRYASPARSALQHEGPDDGGLTAGSWCTDTGCLTAACGRATAIGVWLGVWLGV